MAEYDEMLLKAVGQDRQIVSVMDPFRASQFFSTALSGGNNYTSGYIIASAIASSFTRWRPMSLHFQNRESTSMTVLLHDGALANPVAGPFILNPNQERVVTEDQLRGRFFLSGVYAVVLSGSFLAGITLDMGYVKEPLPTSLGGYLE